MGCGSSSAVVPIAPPSYVVPDVPRLVDDAYEVILAKIRREAALIYHHVSPELACILLMRKLTEESSKFNQSYLGMSLPQPLFATYSILEEMTQELERNFFPRALAIRQYFLHKSEKNKIPIRPQDVTPLYTETKRMEIGTPVQSRSRLQTSDLFVLPFWMTVSNTKATRGYLAQRMDLMRSEYATTKKKNPDLPLGFHHFLRLFARFTNHSQNPEPFSASDDFPTVAPSGMYDSDTVSLVREYILWKETRYRQLGFPAFNDMPVSASMNPRKMAKEERRRAPVHRLIKAFYRFCAYDTAWRDANRDIASYEHGVTNVKYYEDIIATARAKYKCGLAVETAAKSKVRVPASDAPVPRRGLAQVQAELQAELIGARAAESAPHPPSSPPHTHEPAVPATLLSPRGRAASVAAVYVPAEPEEEEDTSEDDADDAALSAEESLVDGTEELECGNVNPCVSPPLARPPRLNADPECVAVAEAVQRLVLDHDWSALFVYLPHWAQHAMPRETFEQAMCGLGVVTSVEYESNEFAYLGTEYEELFRKANSLTGPSMARPARDVLDYARHGDLVQVHQPVAVHMFRITSTHLYLTHTSIMVLYTDVRHRSVGFAFPAVVSSVIAATLAADLPRITTPSSAHVLATLTRPVGHPRRLALVASVPEMSVRSVRVTYFNPGNECAIVGFHVPPYGGQHDFLDYRIHATNTSCPALTQPDLHPHAMGGAGAHLIYVEGASRVSMTIRYSTTPLRLVYAEESFIEQHGGNYFALQDTLPPRFSDCWDILKPVEGMNSFDFERWMQRHRLEAIPEFYHSSDTYHQLCSKWNLLPPQDVLNTAYAVYKQMMDTVYLNPYAPVVGHVGQAVTGSAALVPDSHPLHALLPVVSNRVPVSQPDLVLIFTAALRKLRIPTRVNIGMGFSYVDFLVPTVGWVPVDTSLLSLHAFGTVLDRMPTCIVGRPPMVDIGTLLTHTPEGRVQLDHAFEAGKLLVTMCLELGECRGAWTEMMSDTYRASCGRDYNHPNNALLLLERINAAPSSRYDCENVGVRIHPAGHVTVMRVRNVYDRSVLQLVIEWRDHRVVALAVEHMTEQDALAHLLYPPATGAASVEAELDSLRRHAGQKYLRACVTSPDDFGFYTGPVDMAFYVPAWNEHLRTLQEWRNTGAEAGMRFNWIAADNDLSIPSDVLDRTAHPLKPTHPHIFDQALICWKVGQLSNAAPAKVVRDLAYDAPPSASPEQMHRVPVPPTCGSGQWVLEDFDEHERPCNTRLMPKYMLWHHIPQPPLLKPTKQPAQKQ